MMNNTYPLVASTLYIGLLDGKPFNLIAQEIISIIPSDPNQEHLQGLCIGINSGLRQGRHLITKEEVNYLFDVILAIAPEVAKQHVYKGIFEFFFHLTRWLDPFLAYMEQYKLLYGEDFIYCNAYLGYLWIIFKRDEMTDDSPMVDEMRSYINRIDTLSKGLELGV